MFRIENANWFDFQQGLISSLHLLEEEMVCQVIENHGVSGINGVGLGEKLHPLFNGIVVLAVELKDG